MKIVISGGPCSGKSAVVEKFRENGYYTLPEPARLLGKELGINFSGNITGRERFKINNMIFEKYLEQESRIPDDTDAILDTGMPDNIPYYILYCPGMEIPKRHLDACKGRYNAIFFLEQLPYETDKVRGETEEEAIIIHNMKHAVYAALGYEIISVPLFDNEKEKSLNKRLEFIEREIQEHISGSAV